MDETKWLYLNNNSTNIPIMESPEVEIRDIFRAEEVMNIYHSDFQSNSLDPEIVAASALFRDIKWDLVDIEYIKSNYKYDINCLVQILPIEAFINAFPKLMEIAKKKQEGISNCWESSAISNGLIQRFISFDKSDISLIAIAFNGEQVKYIKIILANLDEFDDLDDSDQQVFNSVFYKILELQTDLGASKGTSSPSKASDQHQGGQ